MAEMDKQRTIKNKVALEGIGLHTGNNARLELLPAPPNSGIVFIRSDLGSGSLIKADLGTVLDPKKFPRRTSIGTDGIYVHTIEHLMAALHLLRVDNLYIDIKGEEVPGMDGSAKDFVEKMRGAGFLEQEAARNYLTIRETLSVEEGSSCIIILPAKSLRISYLLKYDNPLIGANYLDLTLDGELSDNLYEARTFCLEEEVRNLLKMGLGKGSNYENTLVVSEKEIVQNGLRFNDEFIKHKVLDLIGDLYLAGPVRGHLIAVRSGHSLNIKLLDRLRKYKEAALVGGVRSQSTYVPDGRELATDEIMRILPHRYPFLLVDRITYLEKGKRARGVKNVSINEHFFQGHFPGRPVMPGVLIIEAMAQVGGVLMLACEEHQGKLAYFMAARNVKFRKTVEPGDQLVIEVVTGRVKSRTGSVTTKAFVNNRVVAEAELMFSLVED